MSKKQKLNINKIETEDDFSSFLRQFSVSALLKGLLSLSREIYFGGGGIVDNLTKSAVVVNQKTGRLTKLEIIAQPWLFPDLAYQAIKCSNDYRGLTNLTKDMVLVALGQTNDFVSLKERASLKPLKTHYSVQLLLNGFFGEQFSYQTRHLFYHHFARELYIIFSLSKKCQSKINPEAIVKEETQLDWKDLVKGLFGLFLDSCFPGSDHPSIEKLEFDGEKDKQSIFEKLMDYYSSDYEGIRNSELGRQVFYTKPFIRTQNNGLMTISVYLNQFIVEHAVLWVLRNYYQKQQRKHQQDFTNEFGHWFERYFDDLCAHFSIKNSRIVEEKGRKRCDWMFKIGNHSFLVEQKSSIVQLSVKQQLTDFDKYDKEIHKTIYKALEQLETTEHDLGIDKPIKLILCYDDYIDPNLLPPIFCESDCPVKNDHRYFIASILDMEMLFSLASTDKKLFEVVIEEMLRRNQDDSEGKSLMLSRIMQDCGFSTDLYWVSPIFDEYKRLVFEIADSHEAFKKYAESSDLKKDAPSGE